MSNDGEVVSSHPPSATISVQPQATSSPILISAASNGGEDANSSPNSKSKLKSTAQSYWSHPLNPTTPMYYLYKYLRDVDI
ncbi:hypothetical protein VKT23_009587 [Stygiomarasmius scandens]|uniref:Uncharacterized protein n=1 Tax=Marasmiellus scandens TaxID=2682957 RepID=A0ABR1J2C9_9AGAR